MPLPSQYELEHVVLPEVRHAIDSIGYLPNGKRALNDFAERETTKAALFALLGLVHELSEEVYRLREQANYLGAMH